MPDLDYDPLLAPVSDSKLIEIESGAWESSRRSAAFWLEIAEDYVHVVPSQCSREVFSSLRHRSKDWADIVDTVFPSYGEWKEVSPALQRGEYHPRIWRNGISAEHCEASVVCRVWPEDEEVARSRCIAFHRIQRLLVEIFEVVTPTRLNETAHGAAIHQTLALAAMEVETLLRGVYDANSASGSSQTSINSWSALAKPMRLDEWSARLRHFPEWGSIVPFDRWTPGAAPTWWTANNKLKHEEAKSALANLRAATTAVAAIRVLLAAQFGPGIEEMLPDAALGAVDIERTPEWQAHELYFAPRRGHPLVPRRVLS